MGILFILEDNPERLREMVDVLRASLPERPMHIEDDCASAVEWLTQHLPEVDLISLDHDLDSVPRAGEHCIDHGCGRGVADFLATLPPTCPIIIHSANDHAAAGMLYALRHAGWPTLRVHPRDHHNWVKSDWQATLEQLRQRGWL